MEKQTVSRDVYTIVNEIIIKQLEQGTIPWKQPWKNTGLPRNLVTQRPYRGVNYLLLNALNYPFNEFLTFKQVQDLGGRVKKGEHAHLITYWVWHEEKSDTPRLDVKAKAIPSLRYYFVFNLDQTTGIAERTVSLESKNKIPLATCMSVIENMPNRPKILHNENEASYDIATDIVNMPKAEVFESEEAYFHVLFHELIHSTGAEERLNRKELMAMGGRDSETYAIEELTAEIGASYLSSYCEILTEDFKNNTAYIQHWLGRLKSDKRFIIYASAAAQKGTDYILNIRHDENGLVETLKTEVV